MFFIWLDESNPEHFQKLDWKYKPYLVSRHLTIIFSVFDPVLFIIYFNDVDVGLNNRISNFGDDTKIGNSVLTDEDRLSFEEDLHKISAWLDRWEMLFNVDKCQVLQVGTRNKKFDYEMRAVKLKSVQCTKDLGIKIASNFKFSQQCVEQQIKRTECWASLKETFIQE